MEGGGNRPILVSLTPPERVQQRRGVTWLGATTFLEGEFREGPKLAVNIFHESAALGICERTLRRVATEIGISSLQTRGTTASGRGSANR